MLVNLNALLIALEVALFWLDVLAVLVITIGGNSIQIVDDWPHLGHIISNDGNDKLQGGAKKRGHPISLQIF